MSRPRPIHARDRKHQQDTSTTTTTNDRFEMISHKQLLLNVNEHFGFALDVLIVKSFSTITHVLGSQEVKALSHLKGKLQEIINIQRPINILLAQGVLVR